MVDRFNSEIDNFLIRRSVNAILANQGTNGSIIASPDFAQYRFCWLRDGSFSAYALDRAGEHDASDRYHAWVNRAVDGIADVIDNVIAARERGDTLTPLQMPPARFALDGTTVVDDWPNFQIDGYGTWLWSYGEHLELTSQYGVPREFLDSVTRVARYLATFSLSACYDVWEENGDAQHTSTLACVYGGLMTAARLLNNDEFATCAVTVRDRVIESGIHHGYFVKSSLNSDVDASSLWLCAPFAAVDYDDEYFTKTVSLIEDRLSLAGGIRRYPTDVYYGSGAWPVLTGSLGWYYVGAGDLTSAERCRAWIAKHFNREGELGEQFGGDVRDREHFDEWVRRWGVPAIDLTWSHSMYVVLCLAMEDAREARAAAITVREERA